MVLIRSAACDELRSRSIIFTGILGVISVSTAVYFARVSGAWEEGAWLPKLWKVRSRLYRSWSLHIKFSFTAFFEIYYKIGTLLRRSTLNYWTFSYHYAYFIIFLWYLNSFSSFQNFVDISQSVFFFVENVHWILLELRGIPEIGRKSLSQTECNLHFEKIHVGNTGTGQLRTGIPLFEISAYCYETPVDPS